MEKVIPFDGGGSGICPVCLVVQDELSQHLSFHSKEDIIRAVSSNVFGPHSVSNITDETGQSANSDPPSSNCATLSSSTSMPMHNVVPVINNNFLNNAASLSFNSSGAPSSSMSPLQLCQVRPSYGVPPQFQNPNLYFPTPLINPVSGNSAFISNSSAPSFNKSVSQSPTPNIALEQIVPMGFQNINPFAASPTKFTQPLSAIPLPSHENQDVDQGQITGNDDCTDSNVFTPRASTSQNTVNKPVSLNPGIFPVHNGTPQMMYVVPSVQQPMLMPSNYFVYPSPGIAMQPHFQPLVPFGSNGANHFQNDANVNSQGTIQHPPISPVQRLPGTEQIQTGGILEATDTNPSKIDIKDVNLESEKLQNKNETVITLGKNIKISVPSDLASKKEKLKQIINRELVHALLLNDSEDESEDKVDQTSLNSAITKNVSFKDDCHENKNKTQDVDYVNDIQVASTSNANPQIDGDDQECPSQDTESYKSSQTPLSPSDDCSSHSNDNLLSQNIHNVMFLDAQESPANFVFIKESDSISQMDTSEEDQTCITPADEVEGPVESPLSIDQFTTFHKMEEDSTGAQSVADQLSSENSQVKPETIRDSNLDGHPFVNKEDPSDNSEMNSFILLRVSKSYTKSPKKKATVLDSSFLQLDRSSLKDNMHLQSLIDFPQSYLDSNQIESIIDDGYQAIGGINIPDENDEALSQFQKNSFEANCIFKIEDNESVSTKQEDFLSLKASETLEESDQELEFSLSSQDEQSYVDKSIDVPSILNSSLVTLEPSYFKPDSPLGTLNMTLDGNCSIVPCDQFISPGIHILPSHLEQALSQVIDESKKVDEALGERQGLHSPLASTSGVQRSTGFSSRPHSEEEEYEFDYESDFFDSDSDACFGQKHTIDLDKWQCSRCNKTFKSLKEKLLHAGHHSPCSNESFTKLSALQTASIVSTVVIKKDVDSKALVDVDLQSKDVTSSELIESGSKILKANMDEIPSCGECSKVFSSNDELLDHRVKYFRSPKACGFCHEEFESKSAKLAHIKMHPVTDLRCTICHRMFLSHISWCQHQLFHLGLLHHICKECGRTFQRKSELVLHKRKHTGEKPYKCKTCSKEFRRSQTLKRHLLTHMEGQETECDICHHKFKNAISLKNHKFNIHPKKRQNIRKRTDYMCHTCGEVFSSEKKLSWHQETHERWPKKCQKCGECYIHQANLTKHIRLKHDPKHIPEGEKETNCTKCPICQRVYTRSSLGMHMLTHNGLKPYKCNVCNKQFSVKCNYLSHKWVHMGPRDRPFKCKMCDRSFHRKRFLEAHIRSHKNIRPYTCNECGKSFIHKSNLETHEKQHTGVKTFVCPTCGKGFFRKYNLVNHIRVHTGESPYKCGICQKEFTQKSNYNVHMKAFHIERHAVHEEV